jgi:succinate dehydrogenase/fumarate reductase flavoprotein subunit
VTSTTRARPGEVADVIVVGMGAAGLSAAIAAHDAGASVAVVEKAPEQQSGGNSRVAGQVWFCPTNPGAARNHLRAMSWEYPVPDDLVDAWADETARNTDWILSTAREVRGKVTWDAADPYQGDGTDIARIPWGTLRSYVGTEDWTEHEFPEMAGNECGTEYNMIGGSMGFGRLWRVLRTCLAERGIPVRYNARVIGLIRDRSEVAGVEIETPGTSPIRIAASRSVILAAGGFANNREMTRNYLRLSRVIPQGSPWNTGDGIRMAQQLGADLAHPYNYMATPGIAMPPYATGDDGAPRQDRFITVGADGRRFMDETVTTRHGKAMVRGMFDFHPGFPMWTIFDEDGRLAGPIVLPRERLAVGWMKEIEGYQWSQDNSAEVARGWIARAGTLRELAAKLLIDPDGLEHEVELYNTWIRDGGSDLRFGRAPATMKPIIRSPFYGYRWAELMITTLGGLRKDSFGRVIGVDGAPIPRLYCAGDIASTYTWLLSGGMGHADALAFGRLAGRHAACLPAISDPAPDDYQPDRPEHLFATTRKEGTL